jgi:hypothetical protein
MTERTATTIFCTVLRQSLIGVVPRDHSSRKMCVSALRAAQQQRTSDEKIKC